MRKKECCITTRNTIRQVYKHIAARHVSAMWKEQNDWPKPGSGGVPTIPVGEPRQVLGHGQVRMGRHRRGCRVREDLIKKRDLKFGTTGQGDEGNRVIRCKRSIAKRCDKIQKCLNKKYEKYPRGNRAATASATIDETDPDKSLRRLFISDWNVDIMLMSNANFGSEGGWIGSGKEDGPGAESGGSRGAGAGGVAGLASWLGGN